MGRPPDNLADCIAPHPWHGCVVFEAALEANWGVLDTLSNSKYEQYCRDYSIMQCAIELEISFWRAVDKGSGKSGEM
jgi:hypothetical protein